MNNSNEYYAIQIDAESVTIENEENLNENKTFSCSNFSQLFLLQSITKFSIITF